MIGRIRTVASIRPLRFAGIGFAAGATQLTLLMVLVHQDWSAFLANVVSFLAAAQLNFVLSSAITWRDRYTPGSLPRRWIMFHGSIAAMASVNMLVFAIAHEFTPAVIASILGIVAGAAGNYFAGDRIVFRQPVPLSMAEERSAA